MQPSAETVPSPSSFAGLLAALAQPASAPPSRATAWNGDGLGGDGLDDDIVNLTYERALRAHSRYQAADPGAWPLLEPTAPGLFNAPQPPPDPAPLAAPTAAPRPQPASSAGAPVETPYAQYSLLERNLKCASITIRMSQPECAQLRKRAAEAGLTVSAYLRSCTFEAEALRAEVKQALAELRSAAPHEKRAAPAPARRSWFGWLLRLFPRRHPGPRVAQT
jgi:hypothetical protein